MAKLEKLVEDLSSLTVLEAAELSKLLEEKWGVSAAAPVAVAAAAPGAAGGSGRGADRVHRHPHLWRRQAHQRDQGSPLRASGPRAEGSEGPGRRCAAAGQGERLQAGS